MIESDLREISDISPLGGLPFPRQVAFRQLIITGPPGSGKSTEVGRIGGCPGEGYLDLSQRWWRSRVLSLRPREVHLGFPLRGFDEALALFERAWLEADGAIQLSLGRVRLPPERGLFFPEMRRKYAFEFLLPPEEKVFRARRERAYRQSHHIDVELSQDDIREQLRLYWTMALHFHREGLIVFVRDDFGSVPKIFTAPVQIGEPFWERPHRDRQPRLFKTVRDKIMEPLTGRGGDVPVVDDLDRISLEGTKARIRRSDLPIEVTVGPQRIRIRPEPLLKWTPEADPWSVILFDPDAYRDGISGLVRLRKGKSIRIGKGEDDHAIASKLPADVPPRFEVVNDGELVELVDLHSPTGAIVRSLRDAVDADMLPRDRRARMRRIIDVFGGPFRMLEPGEELECLRAVNAGLTADPFRPTDSRGQPGGIIELPPDLTPVIMGDLHANLDNLLNVLTHDRFLDDLERGKGSVIILGDAVHLEEGPDLTEMDTSALIMDVIFKFMLAFPRTFIYVRGNHDSFSHDVTKEGVSQGRAWRRRLEELRGSEYVEAMEEFYDRLPYVVASDDFVACHAGPPMELVSRDRLVELHDYARLRYQLTWNRLQRPNYPAGYTKRDVRALKKALGVPKSGALVVSHTPQSEDARWCPADS